MDDYIKVNKLKYNEKKNYILSFVLLLAAAPAINLFFQYRTSKGGRDMEAALLFCSEHLRLFIYGSILIFLILLCVAALLNNAFITLAIAGSVAVLSTYASMNKMDARGEPLLPEDLFFIGNLREVASMVDRSSSNRQLLLVAMMIAICVGIMIVLHRLGGRFGITKHLIARGVTVAVSAALIIVCTYPILHPDNRINNTNEFLDYEYRIWSQASNYHRNGFFVGFVSNLQKVRMDAPAGYSKERIREIVSKYDETARAANKGRKDLAAEDINIVFIMNESFTAPDDFAAYYPISGGAVTPNLDSVLKQHTGGRTISPAFGGGTANVEFEALTGFSNNFPGASLPYRYYVSKIDPFPSVARTLDEGFGYYSVGIHPYKTTMFKRIASYENMGFDRFYGESEFTYTEKADKKAKYISDLSAYRELFKVLAEKDEKQFVTLITMQNHMPYGKQYKKHDFDSLAEVDPETDKQIEDYLELIKASDDAIGYLTDELNAFDEKTAVVFWGDHLPGVLGAVPPTEWKTPLFICSNFAEGNDGNEGDRGSESYEGKDGDGGGESAEGKVDLGTLSPNCIPTVLFDYLQAKKPAFYYLLDAMKAEYPEFVEAVGASEANAPDTYNDYLMIEYDTMSGKGYSLDMGFYSCSPGD